MSLVDGIDHVENSRRRDRSDIRTSDVLDVVSATLLIIQSALHVTDFDVGAEIPVAE